MTLLGSTLSLCYDLTLSRKGLEFLQTLSHVSPFGQWKEKRKMPEVTAYKLTSWPHMTTILAMQNTTGKLLDLLSL